jgi:chymotrypsin-like protease
MHKTKEKLLLFRGRTNDVTADISPRLLFIDAPVVTNADCARTYGSVVTSSNICISGQSARSTCQGDSGGKKLLKLQV